MFCIASVILLLKACFVSKLAGASHSWLMGAVTTLKPFQFYFMSVVPQAKISGSWALVSLKFCHHDVTAGFFITCSVELRFCCNSVSQCFHLAVNFCYPGGLFWMWSQVGRELLTEIRARVLQDIKSSQIWSCLLQGFLWLQHLCLPAIPGPCEAILWRAGLVQTPSPGLCLLSVLPWHSSRRELGCSREAVPFPCRTSAISILLWEGR